MKFNHKYRKDGKYYYFLHDLFIIYQFDSYVYINKYRFIGYN